MCASQTLELSFLQSAKQFWLNLDRDVSYFIQEEGPLIGQLQPPDFLRDGAGERSFFMTE
jgi:hypothetical protein